MIKTEYPYNGNNNLIRTYSDIGNEIQCVETGAIYGEAVDIYPSQYTYIETDNPIETEEATEEDYQDALRDLGVDL